MAGCCEVHTCCDPHTVCFANQKVQLRVVINSKSYFVSASGSSVKGTQSPTTWLLKTIREDDPWEGLLLFDGCSYIAENSQLTTDPIRALPLIPIPVCNWSSGDFFLKAAGSVTDKLQALTLDTSDNSVILKDYEMPSSSPPFYQQWLLEGSGLTFSCTIDVETVQAGLEFFGWKLTDAEVRLLVERFPRMDYDMLHVQESVSATSHTMPVVRKAPAGIGANVGAVLGGIIGAVGGLLVGGPPGAAAGAGIGITTGANIGQGIELTGKDIDGKVLSLVQGSGIPDTMRSYVSISPSGGPYFNTQVWEDIGQLTKYSVLGEPGLPLAGCVLPPSNGNKFRTWLSASNTIVGYPTDEKQYPPWEVSGRSIYLQLFVIVQANVDGSTKYQLRIHPTRGLVRDTIVHSMLSDGSRFWALIQGAGSDHMKVYAAGELYLISDDGKEDAGTLFGMSAKSGHYFRNSDHFNAEVYATTRAALKALGYTNEIKVDQELIDAFEYQWS